MKINNKFLRQNTKMQRGASLLEVILAIALSLVLIPFMYYQIADMNNAVKDVAIANRIVKSRNNVINYVRMNQSELFTDPDEGAQLSESVLVNIAPLAHSGWAFKTDAQGAEITEVYLAYNIGSDYRTANIAKYIGSDAAVVSTDNVAYAQNWAIGVSDEFDFNPGDLIFRIVYNFGGDDKSKFLHRGTLGDDELNKMQRNLHLNNFKIYNVKNTSGNTMYAFNGNADKVVTPTMNANTITFKSGATITGADSNVINVPILNLVNLQNNKLINLGQIGKQDETSQLTVYSPTTVASKVTISKIPEGDTTTRDVTVSGNLTLGKSTGGSIKVNFQQISIADSLYVGTAKTDVSYAKSGIIVSQEINQSAALFGNEDLFCTARLKIDDWTYPYKNENEKTCLQTVPNINEVTIKGVDVNDALKLAIEEAGQIKSLFPKVLSDGWYY